MKLSNTRSLCLESSSASRGLFLFWNKVPTVTFNCLSTKYTATLCTGRSYHC